jgi:hypothetical protein
MIMYVNGRECDVPTDGQGRADIVEVRRAANVPSDRAIIQQRPTGENLVMPRHGQISVNPYEHFIESPRAKRGNR